MTENVRLIVLLVSVALLDVCEAFFIRREASDIFSLKPGWRLFFFFLTALTAFGLVDTFSASPHDSRSVPWWAAILFVVVALFYRAQPVTTNSQGIAAYRFWGIRRRFISWTDVFSVTSKWQEEGVRFWRITGYEIAVTGRDGTRISHTIFLRKKPQFLDDLRRYLPPAVFAPGLYDWHP